MAQAIPEDQRQRPKDIAKKDIPPSSADTYAKYV